MWKCPVCDQENSTAAMVCPACGYDRTCDYEQYPTAFAVTTAAPTHTLRREWQAKQGPSANPRPQPAPAAAPAKEESSLWTVLFAVAVIAIALAFVLTNREKPADNASSQPAEDTVLVQLLRNYEIYEFCVEVQLGSGLFNDEAVKEAQNLINAHSDCILLISGGVVDAVSAGQIKKLTGFGVIRFSDCEKVTALDLFSNMSSLTSIQLRNISNLDLTGIEKIATLRSLDISRCESVDLQELKNATHLTSLTAVGSNITSLTGLENLTNLAYLDLRNNQISDLQPISSLVDLDEMLLLDKNQISDLRPLSELTKLHYLALSDNQISDLQPISKLTNLTALDMKNNQITTLSGLENLTNLTYIDASGNQLTDTSALEVSGCMDALYTG